MVEFSFWDPAALAKIRAIRIVGYTLDGPQPRSLCVGVQVELTDQEGQVWVIEASLGEGMSIAAVDALVAEMHWFVSRQ